MEITQPILRLNRREDVREFLSSKAYRPELLEAVFYVLPVMADYIEEDRHIAFDLMLGKEQSYYGDPRVKSTETFLPLVRVPLACNSEQEACGETVKKIIRAIEKVVVMCDDNTNLFLLETQKGIVVGVYEFEPEQARFKRERLLLEGMTHISVIGKTRRMISMVEEHTIRQAYVAFDFDNDYSKEQLDSLTLRTAYLDGQLRRWATFFDNARKKVHGTIVLIVSDKYKLEKLQLPDQPDDEDAPFLSVEEPFGFFHLAKENIVLSMLNFDGITIVDNFGNVLAYHVFTKSKNSEGGARRRAFAYLASRKNSEYIAVYLQTQEGNVKFINLNVGDAQNYGKELHYFEPKWIDSHTDLPGGAKDLRDYVYDLGDTLVILRHDTAGNECVRSLLEEQLADPSEPGAFLEKIVNSQLPKAYKRMVCKGVLSNLLTVYYSRDLSEKDVFFEQIINKVAFEFWRGYFSQKDYICLKLLESVDTEAFDIKHLWLKHYFVEMFTKNKHTLQPLACFFDLNKDELRTLYRDINEIWNDQTQWKDLFVL